MTRNPTWGAAPGYGMVGLQPTGGKSNTDAPTSVLRPVSLVLSVTVLVLVLVLEKGCDGRTTFRLWGLGGSNRVRVPRCWVRVRTDRRGRQM